MSRNSLFIFPFALCFWLFSAVAALDPAPAWSYEEVKVTDGGALDGKVVFRGTPPAPRKVIPPQDQQVCGGPRDEPRIILGPDNTVQGAIVFLKGVEKGKPFEKPKKPPVI